MSSRWTGFFIWALVAACTALWGIKIFAATRPVPPTATMPQQTAMAEGPMPRLFGVVAAPVAEEVKPPPQSDRFQLVGVIAPREGDVDGGLAIVSVDSQPPKPWKVGAALEGDTRLLKVARRSAEFGPAGGPASFTLQLPEPAAPETGSLPTAVSQPNGLNTAPPAAPPAAPIPGVVRTMPSRLIHPGTQQVPMFQQQQAGTAPGNGLPPGRHAMSAGSRRAQHPSPATQENVQEEQGDQEFRGDPDNQPQTPRDDGQ